VKRSYYELLRDQLDQYLLRYALIDSYRQFREKKIAYPFVEKRELKPRARIPSQEYGEQNAFLVIFTEDGIPETHKKYIRFFDVNKTTKTNLLQTKSLPLNGAFDRNQKYLDSVKFFYFLQDLLPVDYALLIQRDTATQSRDRYSLSHFHVRIDWPIAEAAEDMAQKLRYISKDIYEKGDKYAEDIQKKFFEYYGLPVMAGGRRTAAIVAAQYLKRLPFISTVYAGSSESRALIRISERGVSKAILMAFSPDEVSQIIEAHQLSVRRFQKNYAVCKENGRTICIFQTTYDHTTHAKPPEDGRLRDIKADSYWLTVRHQHILPAPTIWRHPPLKWHIVYT
jgi:hypothetical protein